MDLRLSLFWSLQITWMMPSMQESVKVTQSGSALCDPHGLYSPWNSLSWNTGVGSLSLLQGIFPTQGSNPGVPHYRWILYQLSHRGNPSMQENRASLITALTPRKARWTDCQKATLHSCRGFTALCTVCLCKHLIPYARI